MKVVALAGGVGAAKVARGLNLLLDPRQLSMVVNTGDDFEHLGLQICPDLDSICYGMAGLNDLDRGWGLYGESWNFFRQLKALGGPGWFQLGDKDLATHLLRTQYLREGKTLVDSTAIFCQRWGINAKVLPMSNQPCPTKVKLQDGRVLAFQEYFVKEACQPKVERIIFPKAKNVDPTPEVLEALRACNLVVICPSNPWLSIDPILNFTEIHSLVANKPVVAISPFIGGSAVKGPAAKMAEEMGLTAQARTLVDHYHGLVRAVVIDLLDHELTDEQKGQGIISSRINTLMKDDHDKRRVAAEALNLGLELVGRCSK